MGEKCWSFQSSRAREVEGWFGFKGFIKLYWYFGGSKSRFGVEIFFPSRIHEFVWEEMLVSVNNLRSSGFFPYFFGGNTFIC